MRPFPAILLALPALLVAPGAQAEVFKCEGPEGGIVFQQTPCPEPAPEADEPTAEAEEGVLAAAPQSRPRLREGEDVAAVIEAEQDQERRSAAVEACKQQYRDAIDAIDLEIKNSYTADQREYYLAQLTALTEKMRAC